MTEQVVIHATLEDLEQMFERIIDRKLSEKPDRLLNAKEAMEYLGITGFKAFQAMGIPTHLRGKRKLYSLKDLQS